MKRRLLAVPVLAFVPWATACEMEPPQQELTDADREAIERVADRYTELTLAEDWDAWSDLFHEDAVRMPQDAPPTEGRDAIRQAAEDPQNGATITDFSAQTEEVGGTGDLAFSRGSYSLEMTQQVNDEEVELQEEGTFFVVVRPSEEDPGEWLIYREMFNRNHPLELPEDAEPEA